MGNTTSNYSPVAIYDPNEPSLLSRIMIKGRKIVARHGNITWILYTKLSPNDPTKLRLYLDCMTESTIHGICYGTIKETTTPNQVTVEGFTLDLRKFSILFQRVTKKVENGEIIINAHITTGDYDFRFHFLDQPPEQTYSAYTL